MNQLNVNKMVQKKKYTTMSAIPKLTSFQITFRNQKYIRWAAPY